MRAPLALHASLRALRLQRSSARLFTINAVKSYSTAPSAPAPPKDKPYYITTPIFYVNAGLQT
jgi:hypothetical protein